MLDSFASDQGSDADRVRRKLLKRAETKPQETVVLLLRNLESRNGRAKRSILDTLTELAKDRNALSAILEQMVHPSRNVRKAVQTFLGDLVGPHAVVYASLFEQTMLVVAMSQRKDIPMEDIVSLAEISKETFMDGEVMASIKDIGFCLDQAKHRYRSSEQLKDYLSDLLKMAPDLSRMGVYSGTLEEPLRKAMRATRARSFDEARDIIEERTQEAKLRQGLRTLAQEIKDNISSRPELDDGLLSEQDREEISTLRGVAGAVDNLARGGDPSKAVIILHEYIDGYLHGYGVALRKRAVERDAGALATMYMINLRCILLASTLLPVTAEGAYLYGFKDIEKAASVHVVPAPALTIGR